MSFWSVVLEVTGKDLRLGERSDGRRPVAAPGLDGRDHGERDGLGGFVIAVARTGDIRPLQVGDRPRRGQGTGQVARVCLERGNHRQFNGLHPRVAERRAAAAIFGRATRATAGSFGLRIGYSIQSSMPSSSRFRRVGAEIDSIIQPRAACCISGVIPRKSASDLIDIARRRQRACERSEGEHSGFGVGQSESRLPRPLDQGAASRAIAGLERSMPSRPMIPAFVTPSAGPTASTMRPISVRARALSPRVMHFSIRSLGVSPTISSSSSTGKLVFPAARVASIC